MTTEKKYRDTMFLSPIGLDDLGQIFEKEICEEEIFEDLINFNEEFKDLSIEWSIICLFL